MLCDRCKKNEANVFIIADINGKKTEFHLCESCAKSSKIDLPFSLMSMGEGITEITSLLKLKKKPDSTVKKSKKSSAGISGKLLGDISSVSKNIPSVCPLCGTTIEDIAVSMRFGCAECYRVFGKHILKSEDDKKETSGVKPQEDESTTKKLEIKKLQARLEIAIKKEDYERAAVIRDEIKKLTEEISSLSEKDKPSV